ncbi:kinase-like domain protein [Rutstroemia sp. NJR-2017a WRK4]|nr:kinase-like domain protein [Rutstroemia sp. NJR-2017a WRK4]
MSYLLPHEISGPLELYMGRRRITATSSDRLDPNRMVYRLKIQKPTIFGYIPIAIVCSMVGYLVDTFPSIKTRYPEWFLPPTVIVKIRKQDWNKEFEMEKRIYHHLKPLQGTVIPLFYGEAIYDQSPAFVISEIHGQRLCDTDFKSRPEADDHILEAKLEEAFQALTEYGVTYHDAEMHNTFEVDDRVMLIDFEQCQFKSEVCEYNPNGGNVHYLMRYFREVREGPEYIRAQMERNDERRMQDFRSTIQTPGQVFGSIQIPGQFLGSIHTPGPVVGMVAGVAPFNREKLE